MFFIFSAFLPPLLRRFLYHFSPKRFFFCIIFVPIGVLCRNIYTTHLFNVIASCAEFLYFSIVRSLVCPLSILSNKILFLVSLANRPTLSSIFLRYFSTWFGFVVRKLHVSLFFQFYVYSLVSKILHFYCFIRTHWVDFEFTFVSTAAISMAWHKTRHKDNVFTAMLHSF